MGDDFDLFPKRENLDPFSFGKKEKAPESEKEDGVDDLFGQQEQPPDSGALPDLPMDMPSEPAAPLADPPVDTPADPPPLPDLPIGGPETQAPPQAAPPTFTPPPPEPEAAVDPVDDLLSGGPISEEKTFDEPVFEEQAAEMEPAGKAARKSPSPFVVVGGALVIIIGLLYGALTYLKSDKPKVPVISTPPAAVSVVPPQPEPVPVPDTGVAASDVQPSDGVKAQPTGEADPSAPGTSPAPIEETAAAVEVPAPQPVPAPSPEPAPAAESVPLETAPESGAAAAAATGNVQYSVQVGAFILDSSVAELEKKLRGQGYEPILKKGSTTAMMNMLSVGPFASMDDGRNALSRLKDAGVDSNIRRRDDGTAIINAGSYLLEENASGVMKKVRSLGYPVKLMKREAKLPMTFVRVGSYSGIDGANGLKMELKDKGLDGIVVKHQ